MDDKFQGIVVITILVAKVNQSEPVYSIQEKKKKRERKIRIKEKKSRAVEKSKKKEMHLLKSKSKVCWLER